MSECSRIQGGFAGAAKELDLRGEIRKTGGSDGGAGMRKSFVSIRLEGYRSRRTPPPAPWIAVISQRSTSRVSAVALLALLAACADRTPTAARAPVADAEAVAPLAAAMTGGSGQVIPLGMGALAINDAGQVAGSGHVWTPVSPGATTGTLQPLPVTAGGTQARAYGINENGVAVGLLKNGAGYNRAIVWTPDGLGGFAATDLVPSALYAWAYDISDAGHITGSVQNAAAAQTRAFRWTPSAPGATTGTLQDLGTLGGTRSDGHAVNSHGAVVGTSLMPDGRSRAFIWTPASGMVSLGLLPGALDSYALDINEAGQVAGHSGGRAFLWTPASPGATTGTLRDLGVIGYTGATYAQGLNDAGDVVGRGYDGNRSTFGIIWSEELGLRRLPDEGWGDAHDINNSGYAAGNAYYRNSSGAVVTDGVIWRGVASNGPPVAALSVPASAVSRHRYVLDASGSTDPDGDELKYTWVVTYGGTPEGISGDSSRLAYTFKEPGVYTVHVYVSDDEARRDTAEATVTVEQNLPPSVTLTGGPVTVGEGIKAVLPFSVSDPNQATDTTEVSTMAYSWVWSDGRSYTGTGWRTFPDQGTYTFTLSARDRGGLVGSVTSTVTVTNTAPTMVVHVPASTLEGATYTITASSPSDAGTADRPTLQFTFDCGRGGGYGAFSTTRAATCPALADQDTFNTRAKVRDKDGGEREYVRVVRVVNARPVVQAQLADPNAPQGPVAFRFTDGGVADGPWQYRVRRGNGTYTAWMPATPGTWITTPAYAYPSGSHAEAVYVRDKDGGIGYSAPVTLVVP